MSKYAPHGGRPSQTRATSSTLCQKCLGKGHFTFECKNSRPYVTRPSRTQQLQKPGLLAKLKADGKPSVEVPEEFKTPDGTANRILAGKEKERAKASSKGKEKEAPRKKTKRSHSRSDSDSDSDSSSNSDSSSSSGSGSDSGSDSSSSGSSSSSSSRSRERDRKRRVPKGHIEKRSISPRRSKSKSHSPSP